MNKDYFHGTSKSHYDLRVKEYGRYQHADEEGKDKGIHIAQSFEAAKWYAKDRTFLPKDTPIVLKIKKETVDSRIRKHRTEKQQLVLDFVNLNELEIILID